MSFQRRITQKDIAKHLGISQVTVSRALARNPLVPLPLQDSVQKVAKQLGYKPDPVLSWLSSYRQSCTPIDRGQTLAWIVGPGDLNTMPWYHGAVERAPHYGYRVRPFNPNGPNLTLDRMMKVIYNQGISGLIIPPRTQPYSQFKIDLTKFCAVTIGYTLREPNIDRVITDHYINMGVIYRKLVEYGYRRIGYVYNKENDQRLDGRELSAFIYQQEQHPDMPRIPALSMINGKDETIDEVVPPWITQWQPDVIICHSLYIPEICKRMGLRIPKDIGIVTTMVSPHLDDERSGINQLTYEAGILAVDTLVSLLRNNERGIPAHPRTIMINGTWMDGRTIRIPPGTPTPTAAALAKRKKRK